MIKSAPRPTPTKFAIYVLVFGDKTNTPPIKQHTIINHAINFDLFTCENA